MTTWWQEMSTFNARMKQKNMQRNSRAFGRRRFFLRSLFSRQRKAGDKSGSDAKQLWQTPQKASAQKTFFFSGPPSTRKKRRSQKAKWSWTAEKMFWLLGSHLLRQVFPTVKFYSTTVSVQVNWKWHSIRPKGRVLANQGQLPKINCQSLA